ncbi:MAG: sulfatase/phosphatase domain-containing protein, partial [Acidobacteriota bacterium]
WPGKITAGRTSDYLGYFPDIMTTIADATGTNAPADMDGISILPELIGGAAAGRKQTQHEYLYWEIGNWTAVRQGNLRAVQPAKGRKWELYDVASDPSESRDIAQEKPGILAKLTALAANAHEPVREGSFSRTDRKERDQRAKFGKQDEVVGPKAKQ